MPLRLRHRVFGALAALGALAACAEDHVLLTIDARPTVHAAHALEVSIRDDDGATETQRFDVPDGALGKSLVIATEGRTGELEATVRALGEDGQLVGLGARSFEAGGGGRETLLVEPTELGLNARIAGTQSLAGRGRPGAQLVVGSNGSVLTTWESERVMARLLDARTRPIANATELTPLEFAVSSEPAYEAGPVAAAGPDRWAIAWYAQTDTGRRVLHARTFGLTDAAPRAVDGTRLDNGTDSDSEPDLAAIGRRFALTWKRRRPSPDFTSRVMLMLLGEDGAPLTAATPVSGVADDEEAAPDVAALATGGLWITWGTSNGALMGRRFDDGAAPIGDDRPLSGELGALWVHHARIAARPDAGFAVASMHSTETTLRVSVSLFGDDGALLVDREVARPESEGTVDVTVRADGVIAVVWTDGTSEDGARDIFLRLLDAGAEPCSEILRVHTSASGDQREPSVAPFGADAFVVAWTDDAAAHDPDGTGVSARVLYPRCE